jgi:hypothetical protein
MQHVIEGFKKMLGLPNIQGTIDVVQIHIHKPKLQAYATNYYTFKSKIIQFAITSYCRP